MTPRIWPLQQPDASSKHYDFGLAAIGYESRGRHFFEHFRGSVETGKACSFEKQQELDYARNQTFFSERRFTFLPATVHDIKAWAGAVCAAKPGANLSVAVDISSMTRQLISACCFYLFQSAEQSGRNITVDFVYSPAEFGDIPPAFGPIIFNGPSIDGLAGWPENPALPCGVILGVGYEEDLALGVIEELEAAEVWAFRPRDHDPRYDKAIDDRNRGLFEEIAESNVVRYSVFDPYTVFASVEALIALSRSTYRLIAVPFGPKIFALASCWAALRHYPEVGIWRVSGGANLQAVDRKPLGRVLGLRVTFGSQEN